MPKRRGWKQRIGFAFKIVGVALVIAAVTGIVYEQIGRRRDRSALPQIGRSVDIGGYALNIYCSGEGSPVVIFDSGNGDPGLAWFRVQPEVAKRTRACWYDRAGEGWSDPGPFPRTSETMAREQHALLERAGIPGPYILVGQSLGGLNARVYAGLFPSDVAGAVLVDAAHEDEPRRAPKWMLAPFHPPRYLWRPIWITAQAARVVGLVRLTTPRIVLADDSASRSLEQIVQALRMQPKAITSHADPGMDDSYAQAERSPGFGDRPLIVLTRGRAQLPPNPSPMDREGFAYEQVWMHEIQPKLAKLSTRGVQIIVPTSGHRMHEDAPQAVIAAIDTVLAHVRKP
jgi:pimeloyl-ACP methyl ester carboxylesterase